MAMVAGGEKKPHAVCMPIPGQGHINPMLKLAKLLHIKGFHITFVHTEFNYKRILKARGSSSLDGTENFVFETIPDGLPPLENEEVEDHTQNIEELSASIRDHGEVWFRDLVGRLNDGSSSGVPPVTCIISDYVTNFTHPVAAELGVPVLYFLSMSACSFMGFFSFKQLVERGLFPLKSEDDLYNGYLDTRIDWIPGLNNIRLRDLPSFLRTTDPDDFFFNYCKDESQCALQASAMIINTFEDLEGPVLDAMSSIFPPLYPVGPLHLMSQTIPATSPLASIGINLWKEDNACLAWLEERPPCSVVYLNFGSLAVLSNQQLVEFAWGLAKSKHDFLWIIRPDLVRGDTAVLPQDFLEETKGRSMLTSWCPQEQVLGHGSVGVFLTHCGWNSMMESLSCGVPMICWPFFSDQPTNSHYACEEWGVGVEIDGDVKREEVEGVIREVMHGEKGMEMRKKALEWKESAMRAAKPDGISFFNLDRVIHEVIFKNQNV